MHHHRAGSHESRHTHGPERKKGQTDYRPSADGYDDCLPYDYGPYDYGPYDCLSEWTFYEPSSILPCGKKAISGRMEPDWTKQIPSSTICNFFYAFFIIYAIIFALSVIGLFGTIGYMKKMGVAGLALGFQGLLMSLIGGTMMLFYYLICDRALVASSKSASA
jgi:hypothetical protein